MNSSGKHVRASVLLACAAVLSHPNSAQAQSGNTTQLGSVCRPEDFTNSAGKYNAYGIRNDDLVFPLSVYCPIPRFRGLDGFGTTSVWVYDRDPSVELKVIRCALHRSGNTAQQFCSSKCSGSDDCSNPGYSSQDAKIVAIPGNSSDGVGYYRIDIYAEIPPWSVLGGYSHVTTIQFDES